MKLTIIFCAVISANITFSLRCPGLENNPKLFPVNDPGTDIVHGTAKGGFIDATGKIVIPMSADLMPTQASDDGKYFKEGLEPVEVQLKTKWPPLSWGYLDAGGNFAIEPQYEQACPFSEGLAAVAYNQQPWDLGYIDHTGKFVIAAQFKSAHPFSEGLAQVQNRDYLMGYIDHDGKWIIAPQYSVSGDSDFSEGLACVGRKAGAQTGDPAANGASPQFVWGYIDKTGAQVIDFKFSEASAFHDGLAAVRVADGFGYIDKTGKFIIPPRYNLAWSFSEGLARVEDRQGKPSYINKKGDVVFTVDGLYWADPFSEGLANVEVDFGGGKRLYGYIDHAGRFIITPRFRAAKPFGQGRASVVRDDECGYINKSGVFVWKAKLPDIFKGLDIPH